MTYIPKAFNWNVDQLRHLIIAAEDLACSSPTAGRNSHTGKDAVVLHQTALKPHLDKDQFNIGQALHSLAELGSELVQLSEDLLPGRLLHVLLHILIEPCVTLHIVEGLEESSVIFGFEKLVHALLWWIGP